MPWAWRLLAAVVTIATLSTAAAAADMPGMPGMAMHGGDVKFTQDAGKYRVEFHVLPPEEFFSAAQVAARQIHEGMLIVAGASALPVHATPAPTHHLVVHVFDRASEAPVTDAKVQMTFRATDSNGHPGGPRTQIPIVVMQAIGGGAASTHYGNNVVISPGTYVVVVSVNGATARFPITLKQ